LARLLFFQDKQLVVKELLKEVSDWIVGEFGSGRLWVVDSVTIVSTLNFFLYVKFVSSYKMSWLHCPRKKKERKKKTNNKKRGILNCCKKHIDDDGGDLDVFDDGGANWLDDYDDYCYNKRMEKVEPMWGIESELSAQAIQVRSTCVNAILVGFLIYAGLSVVCFFGTAPGITYGLFVGVGVLFLFEISVLFYSNHQWGEIGWIEKWSWKDKIKKRWQLCCVRVHRKEMQIELSKRYQ
jgi:hypothetical protein